MCDRHGEAGLRSGWHLPIRTALPSLLTLAGLCAGLASVQYAIAGHWQHAVASLVVAVVFDGLDGWTARRLKASSRFGAELDSLADFASFGLAPAVLVYTCGLRSLGPWGWVVASVFAVAAALRLARFNALRDEPRPAWRTQFFRGVPTPAGAMIVCLPLHLGGLGLGPSDSAWFLGVVTVLTAVAMVSSLPTFSGELLARWARARWMPLIAVAWTGLLFVLPHGVLATSTALYVLSIPVSWRQAHAARRGATSA